MTIDEAIEILKDGELNPCVTEDREACDMAIKALERESCKDAVSRRAVLDTLDKMDSVLDEDRTVETYKELLAACYNDLPSVTPIHKDRTVQDFVDKCRECGKQKKGKLEWPNA